ncbi:MAG: S8 family serine peptidase, partial [Planctomycetota bacterium]
MTKGVEKRLVPGLAICLMVLFHSSGPANADDLQAEDILQPQGLRHTGVYTLQQMDPELTGAGVKFAIVSRSFTYVNDEPQNDYRPNIDHRCFRNAQLTFHDQGNLPAGVSPHSTSICSILLGEDSAAYHPEIGQFYYQGAAPQAQAGIYEFWYFLSNDVFNHTPPDADIISVGIGSPFEDWWTRGIESLVEHYGVTVVAGIGNGADSRHPVLYPGAAANVIGVGVVDSVNTQDPATKLANFALAYPEHSSNGPTSNGQSKPDIVAPGNCLAAEANEPNQYEPTGDWSSFATPIVAGTAGLLVQKARLDPGLSLAVSPRGGNCVIKAILLNSAAKLPYWHKGQLQIDDDHLVPLDYIQGAGMLNAVGAYENLVAGLNRPGEVAAIGWDLNSLDKSETRQNVYRIALTETIDKYITATVVWNRHYSRSYPFPALPERDINLRLELWAVDPANPGN